MSPGKRGGAALRREGPVGKACLPSHCVADKGIITTLYQDIIKGSSGQGRGEHQTRWMLRWLRGLPIGTLGEGRGRNGAR